MDLIAHYAARLAIESNPACQKVRKLVGYYNRGIITEMDLVQAILDIDPESFPA